MRVLITAGPTREPIDAVRFISNRSSGQTGVAVAAAALQAGDAVTLLAGPGVDVSRLSGARIERFESCADLQRLLGEHFASCDVLVMAAAVADYRPAEPAAGKLARGAQGAVERLALEPTPDVVGQLAAERRGGQKVVAFALEEPEHVVDRARAKLERKGVDAIVANTLAAMEGGRIRAWWLAAAGEPEGPVELDKPAFGRWLMERVHRL